MLDDVNPTPGGDTLVAEQPGTETPQVAAEPADVQAATVAVPETKPDVKPEPKAEEKPAPEKTYTHKEWQERETARDKEVAEYRQAMAQLALHNQIVQMQSAEAQAQAQDAKLVESGQITEADAQLRTQQRMQQMQLQQAQRQQVALTQQQLAAAQGVMQEAEKMGRALAAEDLAKQYGVDPKDLLHDDSIKNFDQMEAKALKMALKAVQKEIKTAQTPRETFDSGKSASGTETYEQSLKARYPKMFAK